MLQYFVGQPMRVQQQSMRFKLDQTRSRAGGAATAAPEQLGAGRCLQFFLMVIILAVVIIIILKVAGVGALKNVPLPLPTFKVGVLLSLPIRVEYKPFFV